MRIFSVVIALLFLGACEVDTSQTESCAHYVRCMEARDALLGITTNIDRFLPEGTCWGDITAGQELCDRSCEAGLKYLQDRDPDVPEACQP
jgi:hypothetical protein